jgi:ERCC4-type nuclease
MKIQISDKELSRIKSATSYYEQQGHEVTTENLQIGDYIFDDKVVFEFKTIPDFVASIQDNRVFNEAINQAEAYDYHYVIIQGDEHNRAKALAMSRNYREVSYFQYLGAIASLNRYTTVIESYSPFINEAYYRMLITAKKCLHDKPIVKKFPRKHRNPAFNYLAYCIYGVSAKRAKDIVYYCHLKTMEDLFNLTHQDLVKIDGIGDNLAHRILTAISEDSYES